jgi:hypothetical protein
VTEYLRQLLAELLIPKPKHRRRSARRFGEVTMAHHGRPRPGPAITGNPGDDWGPDGQQPTGCAVHCPEGCTGT